MSVRALALRTVLLAAALAPAIGCKSESEVRGMVGEIGDQIDRLLGRATLPGKLVGDIAAAHEPPGDGGAWVFRGDPADAFEKSRDAVRGLASCDYARWEETADVVLLLAIMADEHPSALLRAECLDTLSAIHAWASAADPATDRRTTDAEVMQGLQLLREAGKLSRDDAGAAADVANAINMLAAFRFDAAKAPSATADPRAVARVLRSQAATCRGVLKALSGNTIAGFQADPRVREALDRAWVAGSASTIRAALLASACGDRSEIVRAAAAKNLGVVRPEIGATVLAVAVRADLIGSVRREAARAMGRYDAATAVPGLLAGLDDDLPEVRSAAAQSLAAFAGESFGEDRAAWQRWAREKGFVPASSNAAAK